MMFCNGFVQGTSHDSMGNSKNSCQRCGRTREAHVEPNPPVVIKFAGKIYTFASTEDAMAEGFWVE